jgi:hypothetical protein
VFSVFIVVNNKPSPVLLKLLFERVTSLGQVARSEKYSTNSIFGPGN